MIISQTNTATAYPFIPGCSRNLGTGLKLHNGIIVDANLSPACGNVNYAQISRLGRSTVKPGYGEIVITSDQGEIICTAYINLAADSESYIIGTAFHAEDTVCGHIVCTPAILPILRADYRPAPDSLIFTPSVFRPRPAEEGIGKLKDKNNEPVHSIRFSPKTDSEYAGFSIDPNTGTVSLIVREFSEPSTVPVQTVLLKVANIDAKIKGVRHLRVIPSSGSPLRISAESGELRLGVGCELS